MSCEYRLVDGVTAGVTSAAGAYCYDCKITLRRGGENFIFDGSYRDQDRDWLKKCPKCGAAPNPYVAGQPRRRRGAGMAMCFSWHLRPEVFYKLATEAASQTLFGDVISDEYGRLLTLSEFLAVVADCAIQRYDYLQRE